MKSIPSRLLTVCIPAYEMHGTGVAFLKHSLNVLTAQTFRNFDVVVSDDSRDDHVRELCKSYEERLCISYHKNPGPPGISSNLNNAIRCAKGQIIKILFQDDFLASPQALEQIKTQFNLETDTWLVTACQHTSDGENFHDPLYPRYKAKIYLGKNTIGAPSVLSIKNDNPLLFDPELKWLLDCDYYRRCFDRGGPPKIMAEIGVVIRHGAHQATHTSASMPVRKAEREYMIKKYATESRCRALFRSLFRRGA